MAGIQTSVSPSESFRENAGTVVLPVSGMKITGGKLTFDLPDALSHSDSVQAAQKIVITENKAEFLKSPGECAHVTVNRSDISRENYSFFSGTATIGVANLDPQELSNAVKNGCAVAEIDMNAPETPPAQTQSVRVALN